MIWAKYDAAIDAPIDAHCIQCSTYNWALDGLHWATEKRVAARVYPMLAS
jgi:hypothetical protein